MSTNSEAMATELTIKVRRPRVAVTALLWSGITLSALLSLTYTHSFANYGRPEARAEDEDRHTGMSKPNGDSSAAVEEDDDRDEEVEEDENEDDENEEEEKEQRFPQRITRIRSRPSTFLETVPTVIGDEIPDLHTADQERSIAQLLDEAEDAQPRPHATAHAHAAAGRSFSSSAAGPEKQASGAED